MRHTTTLATRLSRLRTLRNQLRANVSQLDAEIDDLEKALRGRDLPRLPRIVPGALRLNRITAAEAAEKVMRGKGPMTVTQIVRAIERRRLYTSQSRNFYATVLAALLRKSQFDHVGKGTYVLRPGRPKKRKPRVTWGDAAEQVLRGHDGAMKVDEITSAIQQRRLVKSKAKSVQGSVAATLSRDSRFRRVARGRYELAERRRKSKRTS